MVAPLTETAIDVVFTPVGVDDDIRQEGVMCLIEVKYVEYNRFIALALF